MLDGIRKGVNGIDGIQCFTCCSARAFILIEVNQKIAAGKFELGYSQ